jgi:hypothetical protein
MSRAVSLSLRRSLPTSHLVLVVISSLLTGCIAVRGGDLTVSPQFPLVNGVSSKSVVLSISGNVGSEDSTTPTHPQALQLIEGQAQRAYMDSTLFSHVSVTKEPGDILAEIHVREDGSEALAFLSGFISGFSMGIIPGYANATLTMDTVFKNQFGNEIGSIKKSESVSIWIQLFLVFAMPFKEEPKHVIRDIYYDLNRATLEQALKEGFLNSALPTK